MPRWMKVARGMIGTGVVFSAGIGTAAAVIGVIASFFSEFRMIDVIVPAARFAVLGFPIGVVFSGLLALLARGRTVQTLSVARFAAMGAGVGLVALLLLLVNGYGVWTPLDYVVSVIMLPGVGAAVAAASLLIARRSGGALPAGPDAWTLDDSDDEPRALHEANPLAATPDPRVRAADRLR